MKRTLLALAVLAVVAAVPVAAQEGPRISHGARDGRPFSPAVQVGNIYWLSGKIGVNGETRGMTEGRVAAETRNILNAFKEQLAEYDMTLANTVRGVVYLTDVATFSEFNQAWLEFFPSNPPTRVTVAVAGLVADAQIEISFIAVKN